MQAVFPTNHQSKYLWRWKNVYCFAREMVIWTLLKKSFEYKWDHKLWNTKYSIQIENVLFTREDLIFETIHYAHLRIFNSQHYFQYVDFQMDWWVKTAADSKLLLHLLHPRSPSENLEAPTLISSIYFRWSWDIWGHSAKYCNCIFLLVNWTNCILKLGKTFVN